MGASIDSIESRILMSRALGIDVSHYQGTINWSSVYGDGVKFAYMKATEGSSYTDPTFTTNITGATNAHIVAGAYDFADFNTVSATSEAAHFESAVGSYMKQGYLRPVLDMEGSTTKTKAQVSTYIDTWLNKIWTDEGVRGIVYTNPSFASSYINSTIAGEAQLWIANYNGQNLYTGQPSGTGPWSTWTMWQVSSTGSISGISGNVDLDAANGDMASYVIPNVVAAKGEKFNDGDTVKVNNSGGITGWDTYSSDGTNTQIPNGTTGKIVEGPVFINGYERYEVNYTGIGNRWSPDVHLDLVTAAASVSTASVTPAAKASTSTIADSIFSGKKIDDVLI